jgi:hypothetical protein
VGSSAVMVFPAESVVEADLPPNIPVMPFLVLVKALLVAMPTLFIWPVAVCRIAASLPVPVVVAGELATGAEALLNGFSEAREKLLVAQPVDITAVLPATIAANAVRRKGSLTLTIETPDLIATGFATEPQTNCAT